MRICSVPGCDRKHDALGYCSVHYRRLRRTGDVMADVPIVSAPRSHVTQHGTMNEYNNYGCRCDPCRAAYAEYQAKMCKIPCPNGCGRMIWKRGKEALCRPCRSAQRTLPWDLVHGTENGYTKRGCRCDICREAASAARRRRRRANPERTRKYDRERYQRLHGTATADSRRTISGT